MCRKYSELYKTKLSLKKISPTTEEEIAALEKKLNLFNLLLLREQAHVHVERLSLERESKSSSSSWFSGWFGYGTETKPAPESDELGMQLNCLLFKLK